MSMWQKFIRWWNCEDEIDLLLSQYVQAQRNFNQSQFLLESAPMIDAPLSPVDACSRFAAIRSKYGFIHPATMSKYMGWISRDDHAIFPGSPTKWLLTPLMPENRILMTPMPMPFLNAAKK